MLKILLIFILQKFRFTEKEIASKCRQVLRGVGVCGEFKNFKKIGYF